jgi:hypothetical protein
MVKTKKKPDPITARARALNAEIAALEAQIKTLGSKLDAAPPAAPAPKLRSTALPHGAHAHAAAARSEPIFEKIDYEPLKKRPDAAPTPEHFNELGVRKYDLAAWFARFKNHFHGPSTSNPRLVHYLAAGSVQGLRTMRYEKRVARNRFLAIAGIVLLVLIGFFTIIQHRH